MISIVGLPRLCQAVRCEPILRSVSAWFGVEEAVERYLDEIYNLPTMLAYYRGKVVGFITLKAHYPTSAEVYVMAVRPELHRQGIGTSLMCAAIKWGRDRNVEYLQVKTLGPSCPDEGYARTRAFYWAMGFRPLEEFTQIWDERNPCLIMVRNLDRK
ncbi:MAG: GNAT family N-acetyltransferase [Anaerolineae bacterium]